MRTGPGAPAAARPVTGPDQAAARCSGAATAADPVDVVGAVGDPGVRERRPDDRGHVAAAVAQDLRRLVRAGAFDQRTRPHRVPGPRSAGRARRRVRRSGRPEQAGPARPPSRRIRPSGRSAAPSRRVRRRPVPRRAASGRRHAARPASRLMRGSAGSSGSGSRSWPRITTWVGRTDERCGAAGSAHALEQQLDRLLAELAHRLADRAERRPNVPGSGDVVEAGDRHVGRHSQARRPQRAERADGHLVVAAHDGPRALVRWPASSAPPACPPASVKSPSAAGASGAARPASCRASQKPANRSCESGESAGPPRNARSVWPCASIRCAVICSAPAAVVGADHVEFAAGAAAGQYHHRQAARDRRDVVVGAGCGPSRRGRRPFPPRRRQARGLKRSASPRSAPPRRPRRPSAPRHGSPGPRRAGIPPRPLRNGRDRETAGRRFRRGARPGRGPARWAPSPVPMPWPAPALGSPPRIPCHRP